MRTRRRSWTRRAARKPPRSRTPPSEEGFEGFDRSHFWLLPTPEGRLYDLVRSALPAGDFIAVPGPSRLLPKLRMTAGCGMLDDQGRSMHRWTTLSWSSSSRMKCPFAWLQPTCSKTLASPSWDAVRALARGHRGWGE